VLHKHKHARQLFNTLIPWLLTDELSTRYTTADRVLEISRQHE